MKPRVLRFAFLQFVLVPFTAAAGHASPGSVHYCRPLDFDHLTRDIPAAAKRLADLDAGPPRTVRLIYFLPGDRPYRPGVVDSIKTAIRQVQSFYARQLRSHGYGDRTFRIETDARGEPLVHRVDGRHPDSHYVAREGEAIEVGESFDFSAGVYLIVSDNSSNLVGAGSARGQRRKEGKKQRRCSDFRGLRLGSGSP